MEEDLFAAGGENNDGRSCDMKRVAKSCLLLLLSTLPFDAGSQSARDARSKADLVLGGRIAEGVAFAGSLWLRGTTGHSKSGDASGALVALSLADLSRREHIDDGVLAIEKIGDDSILALSLAGDIARCHSKRRQGYRWAGLLSFEKRKTRTPTLS